MSKKRHRDRMNSNYMNSDPRYQMRNNMYNSMYNNNPFGINPQQLLNILGGNLDLNSLNSIITSMNKDGFDFNTMNQRMNNNYNHFDNTNQKDMEINHDSEINQENKFEEDEQKSMEPDDNIAMLLSLKKIVDPKRVDFIDKIIVAYKNGKIIY